ncbi:MAG: hypothetical protein AB1560_13715 [Pseudomonadota bacterium]
MADQPIETVRIKIEHREGCIYVSSDDVPGLWLWGKNSDQVLNNISPAIKSLYKHNRGIDVEVEAVPISRLTRWLLRHLLKSHEQSDKYKIYPTHRTLTGAHG